MNIFLDTNIWLRYFIGDNGKQLEITRQILQKANEGKVMVSTSTFVLSEFIYVENSFYKIPKLDSIQDLEAIRTIRNLWLISSTNFDLSLQIFKQSEKVKWSDCMIVAQVPESYSLCSFDKRLEKLISKQRFIDPEKFLH